MRPKHFELKDDSINKMGTVQQGTCEKVVTKPQKVSGIIRYDFIMILIKRVLMWGAGT